MPNEPTPPVDRSIVDRADDLLADYVARHGAGAGRSSHVLPARTLANGLEIYPGPRVLLETACVGRDV